MKIFTLAIGNQEDSPNGDVSTVRVFKTHESAHKAMIEMFEEIIEESEEKPELIVQPNDGGVYWPSGYWVKAEITAFDIEGE